MRAGAVATRRLAGEDLVLFRTRSGALSAVPPFCPHLGAHLGHGGRVEGNALRCPMHGFCFDASGRCVRTGYGKRIPKAARLLPFPVVERDGAAFVWHSTDPRAPAWDLPEAPDRSFSTLRTRTLTLHGHPQETSENSVDVGHLECVHGFENVVATAPLKTEGAYLTTSFAFDYRIGVAVRALYTAHVYGLGYSFVDVRLPGLGARLRQFVFSTPVDAGVVALTLGVRAEVRGHGRVSPVVGVASRALAELTSRAVLPGYVREVERDVRVWEHKRYLAQPALAEGDGPIGQYRKWARQFYPAPAQASVRSLGAVSRQSPSQPRRPERQTAASPTSCRE